MVGLGTIVFMELPLRLKVRVFGRHSPQVVAADWPARVDRAKQYVEDVRLSAR